MKTFIQSFKWAFIGTTASFLLMKGEFTMFKQLISDIILCYTLVFCLGGCGPDYTVDRGEDHMAGAICGTMFFVDYRATEADFQALLEQTKSCEDKVGVETSYRSEDGDLKHAVVIGGKDAKIPGTKYDSCIINWELTPETALRAFRDVCLNRQF